MSTQREKPDFALTDTTLGWEILSGTLLLGILCGYGFETMVVNFKGWITDFQYATSTMYPVNWIPVVLLAALLGSVIMLCGLGVTIAVSVFIMKLTETPPTAAFTRSEIMAYMSKNYHTWTASREVDALSSPSDAGDDPAKGLEPGKFYQALFHAPVRSHAEISSFVNHTIKKYSVLRVSNFNVKDGVVLNQPAVTFSFTYSLPEPTNDQLNK